MFRITVWSIAVHFVNTRTPEILPTFLGPRFERLDSFSYIIVTVRECRRGLAQVEELNIVLAKLPHLYLHTSHEKGNEDIHMLKPLWVLV